ncbi:L,D-transpeptidase [Mesorhizobium sp. M0244]|uniref:L,D-transpeptidase n=1 Tax=Mesorhizobium sp. M0244 TaxID=2956926 RepID=UPI0033363C5E
MFEARSKLLSKLSNSVRNGTRGVNFGTVVDGGWFSASPDDIAVKRSIRTNNPGALNIRPWQKKRAGYVGFTAPDSAGNQTTIYQTPETGVAAWYYLLATLYGFGDTGTFSVADLARKYAGPDATREQVQAYVNGWAKWSDGKLDGNTQINLASNADMLLLAHAMFKHEAGSAIPLSDVQILSGIDVERKPMVARPLVRAKATDILSRIIGSESLIEEIYEDEIQSSVVRLGEATIRNPSEDKISDWLAIFSKLSDLSLEGPGEITLELHTSHRSAFDRALDGLPPDVVFEVRDFLAGAAEPPFSPDQLRVGSEFAKSNVEQFDPLTRSLPVLATFKIDQAFNDSRVVRYTGTLAVANTSGKVVGSYHATTGGFITSYKRKNGPTPPGYFVVGNYRKRSEHWCTRGNIGFTFDIDEVVRTGNRGAFRIHPDGPPPGTHGCVGIVEDGDKLKDCATKLRETLSSTQGFRLLVEYA